MNVSVLEPGKVYRVPLWLPEPHDGDGAQLIASHPNWAHDLAAWLRRSGYNVTAVRVLYGPVAWGPRGYYVAFADYGRMYALDLEITGASVPVDALESALYAALDTMLDLGPVVERPQDAVYRWEPPDWLRNMSDGVLGSLEGTLGEAGALALLALLTVFISRIWPLGGMALLAALLILAITEGGALHAQA
jgi:hypothetical protein